MDPGNYLHYGHEDPVGPCQELAEFTKMARAGDMVTRPETETESEFREHGSLPFFQPVIFGEGEIDQKACYGNLKAGGFDGVVSLKSAGRSDQGPLEAIRQSMGNLKSLLEQV